MNECYTCVLVRNREIILSGNFFPKKFHNCSVSFSMLVHKHGGECWQWRDSMETRALGSESVFCIFPFKINQTIKCGMMNILPVLDQGYDLRISLPNDALSIHLHYPVPWTESENRLQTCCLLPTRARVKVIIPK